MLYWALVFFIIAIIAAFFGFGGVATTAASIALIAMMPAKSRSIFGLLTATDRLKRRAAN